MTSDNLLKDSTKDHLLQDASALLQFSKGSASSEITNEAPSPIESPKNVSQPSQIEPSSSPTHLLKKETTPVLLPSVTVKQSTKVKDVKKSPTLNNPTLSPTSNPGPAMAALSENNDDESKKGEHSMKAIVAAAALAAAASTPLPLHNNFTKDLISQTPIPILPSNGPLEKKVKESTKRVNKRKEKEGFTSSSTEAKAPNYAVDPDAGIIDCICGVDEDDGFTIQCEKCFRWQHASCFNIDTEDVPEIYYCELCDPKSFKAKSIDIKRARDQQLRYFSKDSSVDQQSVEAPTKKKLENDSEHATSVENTINSSSEESKKKRRVVSKDKSSYSKTTKEGDEKPENGNHNKDTSKDNPITRKEKPSRKRKKEDFDDNTNEELISRIESAKDEYFYAVYYNLKEFEYRNRQVESYCEKNLIDVFKTTEKRLAKEKSKYELTAKSFSPEEYEKIRKNKPSIFTKNILISESNTTPSSHFKFSGLSNLGIFNKSAIENGTIINEFFGEVDFQENFFENPINQFKYWGIPKQYYFFINFFQRVNDQDKMDVDKENSENSNEGEEEEEDLSSLVEKDNMSNLSFNLDNYLEKKNSVAPANLLIPLYLNCKTSGNILRFVRKSCYPNCRIIPIVVGNNVKFVLEAIKPIKKNSELTVGWEFDFNPVFCKLYSKEKSRDDKHNDFIKSNFNNKLTNSEKIQLINQVEFVLGQYKCGCYSISSNVNNIKCKLLRIKKMGSYFYRSSRKGSKLIKENNLKIEEQNNRKLIKERLLQRDIIIEKLITTEFSNNKNILGEITTATEIGKENTALPTPITAVPVTVVDDLFQHATRKEIYEHPKQKRYLEKSSDYYSILNSRAQLAKAIIANLSIPVQVKSVNFQNDDAKIESDNTSKSIIQVTNEVSNDYEVKNNESDGNNSLNGVEFTEPSVPKDSVKINAEVIKKLERPVNSTSAIDGAKKVKKMSFADFKKKRRVN